MEKPVPITRRGFIEACATAGAASLAALYSPALLAQARFDLIIRGGSVLDGTGTPALSTDIGIVGDRIAALGRISPEQAGRVVDATGLHVAPGFIDIHTHSDGDIFQYPTADSRVRQGVTTEVTGNCGRPDRPDGPGQDRCGKEGGPRRLRPGDGQGRGDLRDAPSLRYRDHARLRQRRGRGRKRRAHRRQAWKGPSAIVTGLSYLERP